RWGDLRPGRLVALTADPSILIVAKRNPGTSRLRDSPFGGPEMAEDKRATKFSPSTTFRDRSSTWNSFRVGSLKRAAKRGRSSKKISIVRPCMPGELKSPALGITDQPR